MTLVATEQNVLTVVAELKQATITQINRKTGLSFGYAEYLCNYLIRGGYLTSLAQGRYSLAPKGKKILISMGHGLGLDKNLIKELASQVAKEVAKEIKIKGGLRVSPEEEREKIKIRTDYDLPVEDETTGLETNIDKVGAKLEKEKGDSLDASVELLKSITQKGKKERKR